MRSVVTNRFYFLVRLSIQQIRYRYLIVNVSSLTYRELVSVAISVGLDRLSLGQIVKKNRGRLTSKAKIQSDEI